MSRAPFKPEYDAAVVLMRQLQQLQAGRADRSLSISEFNGHLQRHQQAFVNACVAAEEARTCRRCGCTRRRPCATLEGPCTWVEDNPPLCSACEGKP